MGLHLDLERIFLKNAQLQGAFRKNGCIINTGDNQTKQQIAKLRQKNQKLFGLSQRFVASLHLPKAKVREWLKVLTLEQILAPKSNFSSAEKVHHLEILKKALTRKLAKIIRLQEFHQRFKACNIVITVEKVIGSSIAEQFYAYAGCEEKQPTA